MTKFIYVLTMLFSVVVFAAENPNFTFKQAQRAFKTGRQPSPVELLGDWMLVGSTDSEKKSSGYIEDGWYVGEKTKERYRFINEFKVAATDAFGVNRYSTKTEWRYESGRAVATDFWQTDKWTTENSGIFWIQFVPYQKGNTITCGITTECRILDLTGMLLCETRNTGHRYCTEVSGARDFLGFKRPNP